MSKSRIQPPPVCAHDAKWAFSFARYLPILTGALTGGAVFLVVACLWVARTRPVKNSGSTKPPVAVLEPSIIPAHETVAPVIEPVDAREPAAHQQTPVTASEVRSVSSREPVDSSESPTKVKILVESTLGHEERLTSTHEKSQEQNNEPATSATTLPFGSFSTSDVLGLETMPLVKSVEPRKFVEDKSPVRLHEHQLKEILAKTAVNVGLHEFRNVNSTLNEKLKSERLIRLRNGRTRSSADESAKVDTNEFHPMLKIADASPELYGIPFLRGDACKIKTEHAPVMREISIQLGGAIARHGADPLGAPADQKKS